MIECDPWQVSGQQTSQGKPSSGHSVTWRGAREQRGHSGGTPAESGASTPQSVMETDPLISAQQLLVSCTNTLLSLNTVTWHTHTRCSINAHSRGGLSHIPDLVSAAQTFPATYYTSWPTHADTLTNTHTIWQWLSVVSRSADTWKDTLERGPFHSNSARQHLARTRWLTPTVVKGMRVLNSTAAHSALPAEWGEEESFMDTALHRLHTHTHSKALTHPSSTVECEISNLSDRTSGNWPWV